jgi:hypothetical protein|tara:strand:- start:4928 stop:5371 length:444 start_codon:yes stop_codon:yes gene_type:complete
MIRIGVFGGSVCLDEIFKIAEKVGHLLAEKGAVVYCGGLSGVMEAVSKGVKKGDGTVIGILPGNDCDEANEYVTIPVATGIGKARNVVIVNSIQGAIAIDGQYGTLSEIAHTLNQDKPVVGIKTWDIKGVVNVDTPEEAVTKIMELI